MVTRRPPYRPARPTVHGKLRAGTYEHHELPARRPFSTSLGSLDQLEAHGQAGDRKSTRLNSSHVAISDAVFCLKKKNILGVHQIFGMKRCTRAVNAVPLLSR